VYICTFLIRVYNVYFCEVDIVYLVCLSETIIIYLYLRKGHIVFICCEGFTVFLRKGYDDYFCEEDIV
jgi:hypothetical protein